jgi:hypothetical protein
MLENYVQHAERLINGSWEAETSRENTEAADSLLISLYVT